MLSSGGFAVECLQAIAKGGSSILGRPGQTRAMFQASTTFFAHAVYVVIHYMSIICYMSVICLVQSPPQEALVVFGYMEGPFLVSRTGCAPEHHAPCIEGSFLVNRTVHTRERHAP
jgi:hypothetical protein